MTDSEVSFAGNTKDLRWNADNSGSGSTEGLEWTDAPPGGRGRISMESLPSGDPMVLTPCADAIVARQAAEMARREADTRLLELARCHPKALERLRDTLIAYAQPIIEKKIANGDMWREAASARIGVPAPVPTPPALEPEEIESLAAEVVTRAFKRFRRHGLHKWDPAGGLALTTWFYRDCLHQFANAVRAWSKDRGGLAPSLSCLLGLDEHDLSHIDHRPAFSPSVTLDPEAAAISSIALESRLRDIERALGARTRRLVDEHFIKERPLADVAREMGMSRQSAHRTIKRCRKVMIQVWGEDVDNE